MRFKAGIEEFSATWLSLIKPQYAEPFLMISGLN